MANTINQQLLEQFEQQTARHEPIKLLVAYVLKERDDNPDRPWNWCDVCRLEVPTIRQHGRLTRCNGCNRTFIVQHALEVENAKLRTSPWFDGMLHDITSACWGEFSLELATHQPQLEPGSLVFSIDPYELPRERVKIGERKLTRAERRKRARAISGRGRRFARAFGRGRARHVPLTEDVYGEASQSVPEALRFAVTRTRFRQGSRDLPTMRDTFMDYVEHRCYQFGYSVNTCNTLCCGARAVVNVVLYAATDPRKHDGVRAKLEQLLHQTLQQFAMRLQELDMACWRCSRHDMIRHIDVRLMR